MMWLCLGVEADQGGTASLYQRATRSLLSGDVASGDVVHGDH